MANQASEEAFSGVGSLRSDHPKCASLFYGEDYARPDKEGKGRNFNTALHTWNIRTRDLSPNEEGAMGSHVGPAGCSWTQWTVHFVSKAYGAEGTS